MGTVKVSFVGLPGVGKTTIIKLLTGAPPPLEYRPTIGFDLGKISFGEHEVSLFDLAGHERFRTLWPQILKGSTLVILVTDSTPVNVLQSKKILEELKKIDGYRVIAIANKQDLPGAMKPNRVQDLLEVPTYGLVAIDPRERVKMYHILMKEFKKLALEVK
ncbi:MAG: ADP-ribosylation factor-like protein [Candidatus Baldrarchaeia archaeon]